MTSSFSPSKLELLASAGNVEVFETAVEKVDWQFRTNDARIKLKWLYPKF